MTIDKFIRMRIPEVDRNIILIKSRNLEILHPCVDSFYTLIVDKNRHFLTPSPPHLVHGDIECYIPSHSQLLLLIGGLIGQLKSLLNHTSSHCYHTLSHGLHTRIAQLRNERYFLLLKFMSSKKASKIEEIFTVDSSLCINKCQIDGEGFFNFCGLLRKHELYQSLFVFGLKSSQCIYILMQ